MSFDPNAAASPDSGIFGLTTAPNDAQVVLLPVPFEATCSYGGGTSDGRFIAPLGAQVVELGVINASIHKVNESVRVADIDALHRIYVGVMRRLLA